MAFSASLLACGADEGGGSRADDPDPFAEALETCVVEEPCPARAFVQLIENQTHNINATPLCLFSALAERRAGRYRFDTDATFTNGDIGAHHTLVVHADGTATYVREPYGSSSPSGLFEIPAATSQRCTLKPASYFEQCHAAVDVVPKRLTPPPAPTDDAVAWSCTFGDGAGTGVSTLQWFESCVSEAPPSCE